MNKVLLGLLLGAILGAFDGLTAWFTPEVRNQMLTIVIGSTVKGVMAGVLAGWFARKVQSVPAGIVFGLIVGLALAYWVAAMQGKYYFEIMLPGGTVGAILGWATQRYGKPVRASGAAAAALMVAMLFVATGAQAAITPKDALERMKWLAGNWSGTIMTRDGAPGRIEYRVTAGGSAVMETMFPGQPHEMVTMYTLAADGSLVAQHFCAGNNQPVMRLNAEKSSNDDLVFDFVRVEGANTKNHMRDARIRIVPDGSLENTWNSGDKSEPKRFFVTRK